MRRLLALLCALILPLPANGGTIAAPAEELVQVGQLQLCQGIQWPLEFCQQLAAAGFYVIRFDNRDTGLSSRIDFETAPYDLRAFANDALGLLDALSIERAHLVGFSMGGPIVELMAAEHPKRVASITLMATSCDFEPMERGYAGLEPLPGRLSPPNPVWLAWIQDWSTHQPTTFEGEVESRLDAWAILNGPRVPYDRDADRPLQEFFLVRGGANLRNHMLAISRSLELVREAPGRVTVPALVIHGSVDPIFPADHGVALSRAIQGATLLAVEGMGHVPNPQFYPIWVAAIKRIATL
jgi:pimeloyl-ACP methyl ester carboxylesterase